MKPQEIIELVRVSRPPSPYGARQLARTYSIDDIADTLLLQPVQGR